MPSPPTRFDWEPVARDYDRHRRIPSEGLAAWRRAVAPHAPPPGGPPLLDLGAGTGLFAAEFARSFDVAVAAVEPSAGMRAEGRRLVRDPRVRWIAGRAERLPLADASCHAAWLSTVVHHLEDLGAAARELRRVVRPGGAALVRNVFPGRQHGVTLFRWFPGASRVVDRFPSVERVVAAFETCGFAFASLETVPQTSAPDLRAFAERVRLRADSTLRRMDDAEFEACLTRVARAAADEREPRPVVDWLDLLVLTRVDWRGDGP